MIETNAQRLSQIALTASACTKCSLSQTRSYVVFGEGNPNAPLVFVGEGPGQNEDATGRPFVGRAGALLDDCLAECRMSRKHVYICNIVKCRACVSQAGRIQNRTPLPDEIQACSSWLDQQLSVIRPMVIVCLGAPSAKVLIHRDFAIMKERGQWFDTCRYSRFVMATLHPAFILRQEGDAFKSFRQSLVMDIESARKKVIEARASAPKDLFDSE